MSRHNDPPYFPFYPDDFASDGKVEAMTTEEVGAYTLLLCKAWREDPPGAFLMTTACWLAGRDWRPIAGRNAEQEYWLRSPWAQTLGSIKNECVGNMRNSGSSNKSGSSQQSMLPMQDMRGAMRYACATHANRKRHASGTNAFHFHIQIQQKKKKI